MKVGVLLEDYSPDIGGGSTFQADIFESLLELAGESKHTFVVFCRLHGGTRARLEQKNIEFVAFPGSPLERAITKVDRKLKAVVKNHRQQNRLEQLAQAQGVEFIWFLSDGSMQVDIPYLAIVWDMQHRLQPWFPEVSEKGVWERREAFYSRFLRRASVIITGTEAGRAEVERFYQVPTARIKILPHPTPRFALDGRQEEAQGKKEVLSSYGVPDGYLFYPAQFWSHKNHVNLLLAVQALREKHGLSLPVVFVGSDKGNQRYVRGVVEELGLSGQVHFLGFVSQDELVALYRNAFALTYVTFFGPENLPPLEAFVLGCPVVASNVSGAQEQLGDAALLVDPQDPEQIALAIKALHDDPALRQRLIQRGLERGLKWTGRDFVRGVFSIFDEFERVRRSWGK